LMNQLSNGARAIRKSTLAHAKKMEIMRNALPRKEEGEST